jgi:DNA gyrase subunit A
LKKREEISIDCPASILNRLDDGACLSRKWDYNVQGHSRTGRDEWIAAIPREKETRMDIERPDLSRLDPDVRAYIESLEAELERLHEPGQGEASLAALEPSEPPTPFHVITISASGLAKRTPRHLYDRQRRGGMGVFDLETSKNDPPAILTIADEQQTLVLVTNQARAFRLPVCELLEAPVHGRGQSITAQLPLVTKEYLTLAFPDQNKGYIALVSQNGYVRCLRHHYLGENLRPGTNLYSLKDFGPPSAACWTSGDDDLFLATRQGRAIRFAEKSVPLQGGLGIRVEPGDVAVAIAAVSAESCVFILAADGKGTLRRMSGFSANKTPGGGGKTAIKSDHLVGAVTVEEDDDIFVISRLSKIIRFRAAEVPPKEDAVQGVNCMALRADETVAVVGASL